MIAFDHIALSSGTLSSGVQAFRDLTGITLPPGGKHPLMSTHNCVTATGPDTFLEVITNDPAAPPPGRTKWFGLDDITEHAPLHTRALLYRTDDIDGALAFAREAGVDLGEPLALSRGDLTWSFSVRDDGAVPYGGVGPMLLQWDQPEPHPATRMPDLGIRIVGASISTPEPAALERVFDGWAPDRRPDIREGKASLTVTIALPSGHEVTI